MKSYKELIVWRKAMDLVKLVYLVTNELPDHERYGLSSQMRRASVSIPSNIAEGYKRHGTAEYIRFLGIAEASSAELETQLILLSELYGVDIVRQISLLNEVQKMLHVIQHKLRKHPKP